MSPTPEQNISPEIAQAEIKKLLPIEHQEYLAAMHDKHFIPEKAIGSLFTEAKNVEELLAIAFQQRGSLSGDDREKFIALGIAPEALMPQCRYLKVDTKGEVGITKVTDLSPETKVKVLRTKPGAPCSLVVAGVDFPEVDFGTIIIGPNERGKDTDPEPSTKEMVWTVHPGLPVRPASENYWEAGSEITVQDVKDRLGENIFLNIQKPK